MYWYESEKSIKLENGLLKADEKQTPLPNWHHAVETGKLESRAAYLHLLRERCIAHSLEGIRMQYGTDGWILFKQVGMLSEIDSSVSRLTEKLLEWDLVIMAGPRENHATYPEKTRQYLREIASRGDTSSLLAQQIIEFEEIRKKLLHDISRTAKEQMPNCSALLGPVVAARLVCEAGGLHALSILPSSTIQVLGAKTGLFSHIKNNSAPPKHGIIYQHKRVHAAKRAVRGKVARTLAARVSIASKIDYYRKELDPQCIAISDKRLLNAATCKDTP
ncbi:MAG: RNA-processing protein [Methanomicrobiales archaeon]|jgi:nucleolar protein 56|nr:RNA-processing protein [Methanomicrobiales archaeon]